MTTGRFVVATFCDDIREEVGNKVSFMGCYDHELVAPSLPITLPRLCAHIRLFTPAERPFAKVVVRAFLNSDLLGELSIPPDVLAQAGERTPAAVMVFTPLAVAQPSRLRVEIETEAGTLEARALTLRAQEGGNGS